MYLGKRELQIWIENEDTAKEYILTSSIRSSGKIIAYIIGVYRKNESKEEITEEIKKIINRI